MICAWTPRELVRKATERAAEILDAPYVVHLEDNEEHLLSARAPAPLRGARQAAARPAGPDLHRRLRSIPPTTPRLIERAPPAVTVITEELNEFNFGGRPHHIARPGIDHERFRPDLEPPVSREALGLRPDDFVLVYHGIGHYANQHEMLSLYLAVKLLQRRGRPVRLVRLGETELGGRRPARASAP